jgi:hypothetical protein
MGVMGGKWPGGEVGSGDVAGESEGDNAFSSLNDTRDGETLQRSLQAQDWHPSEFKIRKNKPQALHLWG